MQRMDKIAILFLKFLLFVFMMFTSFFNKKNNIKENLSSNVVIKITEAIYFANIILIIYIYIG